MLFSILLYLIISFIIFYLCHTFFRQPVLYGILVGLFWPICIFIAIFAVVAWFIRITIDELNR